MKKILLPLLTIPLLVALADDYETQYRDLATNQAMSDSDRLHRLFEIDWDRGLHESPEFATSVGYPGLDDRWTDVSEAAIEKRKAENRWPLSVINVIDRAKLLERDQLNYDLFKRDLELDIEGDQFPGELLAISQLGGVQQGVAQVIDQMQKGSVKNYEDMLSRLRAVPKLVDQNIELLKRGIAKGVTQPKVTLRDVPQQILNLIPDDPLKSALLRPFTEFPESIPAPERERLRTAAIGIYRKQLVPAYRKLHGFVVEKYLPAARESVAFSALPDGAKWYAFGVRQHTTTNLTPQEIHEIGQREVKRIRGEMDRVISEAKFEGSFEEFSNLLRSDPQFLYKNPEELLAGFRDIAKRIDPELARLFGKLPRLTYGVKAIPAYAEESAPAAYYDGGSVKAGRPGWFYANTSNLASRPKWQMECLTLHEAVPGHHLQISLAQEMDEGPEFRKYSGYTAFIEGWGLYAESLGDELGLYKTAYSKFGALTFEMWRAVRLVVDTGIHAMGWSREQALEFMLQNTPKDLHESTVEIDRYIVWPGQALAYKIGQLKLRELRADATRELGSKFDIRSFHDALLANGALPLDVLETRMKEWIAAQKTKPAKSGG